MINEIITSQSKYNKKVLPNHPFTKDAIAKGDTPLTLDELKLHCENYLSKRIRGQDQIKVRIVLGWKDYGKSKEVNNYRPKAIALT